MMMGVGQLRYGNVSATTNKHHNPALPFFADDATDFASDSDINNVHATVNRQLVGVDNWLKANRLSLNVSKTS